MSDARREGTAPYASGGAWAPDLKIVRGVDHTRVIVPVDDPPQREGLLGVALAVLETAGEIAKSCGETKKKLLELHDRVAQCLPDPGWDDADASASPEELVDDVASMVGELIASREELAELAENVRLGLDMNKVEFESWKAGGCRPQHSDGSAAAKIWEGKLGAVLGESAEILRGVLGDHE